MSLINNNNLTSESTKNELYNSYEIIKKKNLLDEKLKDDLLLTKSEIKQKFLKNNIKTSSNYSKNYCLTTSNLFSLNKKKIIPMSNSNTHSNSFNILNYSPKYNKIKNSQTMFYSKIKNIKERILSIKDSNQYSKTKVNNNNINYITTKNAKREKKFLPLFKNRKKNDDIINNSNNKVKLKELKFKVFRIIQNNYIPLCPNFVSKAENINNKIVDYYKSDNYKNRLKIFNNNLHYKLNVETNPKINKYVNISKINDESSFTKKLNLDKLFSKEEKKLILSEPDYYFKNTNKDCFENVNITKTNKLVEKINKEELIKEELDKRKKRKSKTANNFNNSGKLDNNMLNKTEIKADNYKYDYMNDYRNNRKLLEKLIKKEEKITKDKRILFIKDTFDKEIKNGYFQYRDLLNKNRKSQLKKRKKLLINNIDAMITRKNLIANNYKNIIKYEGKIESYEKLKNKEINNNELKVIQKPESKDNLKNNSNNEENKYIKMLLNKIKCIYNK